MSNSGIWFLNTLVRVRVAETDGDDGISMLEHRAPGGDSPPLHLHRSEDELFHILEGAFRFQIADETRLCGPGDVLLMPKGVPHTYVIESPAGGHWTTVTTHGDFERFVRAFGRPAERDELPPPAGPPTPEEATTLTAAAAEFRIEVVGPPLH